MIPYVHNASLFFSVFNANLRLLCNLFFCFFLIPFFRFVTFSLSYSTKAFVHYSISFIFSFLIISILVPFFKQIKRNESCTVQNSFPGCLVPSQILDPSFHYFFKYNSESKLSLFFQI